LESLTDSLDQYFPSLSSEMYDWVRNPFVGFSQNSLSLQEEEQLTELECDRSLEMKFDEIPLDVFSMSVRKEMSCDLSKSSEKSYISFQLLIFVNKFFHV
jgi:hypothetical protein